MDYGIKTIPDGMTTNVASSDRTVESVPMSIAEALAQMHSRQSDTLGQGSDIGQIMSVPGPVSLSGNEPYCEPDGSGTPNMAGPMPGEVGV